jgi:hypothetical protein
MGLFGRSAEHLDDEDGLPAFVNAGGGSDAYFSIFWIHNIIPMSF